MATNFVKIASVTVGSSGSDSVNFNSIPATYTDLVILASLKTTRSDGDPSEPVQIKFNASTSGYSSRNLQGSGSSVSSGNTTGETSMVLGQATATSSNFTSTFSNNLYYIPNYTSANYKSLSCDSVTEGNQTYTIQELDAGLWSNTSAITDIEIFPRYRAPHAFASKFVQYSTFILYGIKSS